MNISDLNNLDLKTVADWPMPAKFGLLGALFVVIVLAGWWFDWRGNLAILSADQAKEQQLRQTFLTKKAQAVNLDAYTKQLADIKQSFGALLKQLPNRQEMDALITDINQAGLGRGLQFDLFKPGPEQNTEFYAVLPIQIRVTGGYHDLAAFASDVAKLPRIVTLDDISITPNKDGSLTMDATAQTYRYLDDDASASGKKAKGKKS